MSILFHFTLILLKLEHADLLNENPTKKVMLLRKKIVLIRYCNGYLSRVSITDKMVMMKITWPKRPLSLSLNDNDSTLQRI